MNLFDGFGRSISYLRLSVTDRCDFRCVYCMSKDMTFLPRHRILSIEEMTLVAQAFNELGVSKIRITGGEPLIRSNISLLFKNLRELPLKEITLTTNGSQLIKHVRNLVDVGVKRINVSLDSLQADKFKTLTRTGKLKTVLKGIDAALEAGLKIKINSVILKHRNMDEVRDLVGFAIGRQMDISFIEEMPLGVINEHQREKEFVSSADLREHIAEVYPLTPSTKNTGGPSRYWQVENTSNYIGFISPHSDNFCSGCNRVRVTTEGLLLLCLGNEHNLDLRQIIRHNPNDIEGLKQHIVAAMQNKPEKHHFDLNGNKPQIVRFMNMTGG
ncbi:cyclic pyranopterin phosphate synthase MoaA [Candidatus Endobugula sertula]|uniref:GTP 3',8-cyclase n=1 Tax=Candidatus Endobugula sertula TaxID=62101 RepID=A0A1D2QRT7_9GAMM|nr:cyclic pyranopterin phosphate synthase MoaA [Candidatus Endobugula sertula]